MYGKLDRRPYLVESGTNAAKADPVPLVVFPVGCIYRDRAISAIERNGRRWRIASTSQELMGVQAAVASGLSISLLPSDSVLPKHRKLHLSEGFDDQPESEIALVKGRGALSPEVKSLRQFLRHSLDKQLNLSKVNSDVL